MGSPCHGTGSTWIDREVKRLLPYRYGVGMTGACYAQDGGAMCICNPDTAQIRVRKIENLAGNARSIANWSYLELGAVI